MRSHPSYDYHLPPGPRAQRAKYLKLAARSRRDALKETQQLAERVRWGEGESFYADSLRTYRQQSIERAHAWLDVARSVTDQRAFFKV